MPRILGYTVGSRHIKQEGLSEYGKKWENKVKNEQKRNSHTYRMATSLGLSYNNCKILLISSSFCKVRSQRISFFRS